MCTGTTSSTSIQVRMRKLFLIGVLLAGVASSVGRERHGVTGRWRGVVLMLDVTTRDLTIDLKANGATVSGTITGAPVTIREGRTKGATPTLRTVNPYNWGQEVSVHRAAHRKRNPVQDGRPHARADSSSSPSATHGPTSPGASLILERTAAAPQTVQRGGREIAVIRDFKVAQGCWVRRGRCGTGGAGDR